MQPLPNKVNLQVQGRSRVNLRVQPQQALSNQSI